MALSIKIGPRKNKYHSRCRYYGDLIFNLLTQGQTERLEELNNVSVQVGFNRITSQDYYNYFILVRSFKAEVPTDLTALIRTQVKSLTSERVYVDSITGYIPHKIKWRSSSMKVNLISWKSTKQRNTKKEEYLKKEGYTDAADDFDIDWGNRREASWEHFKKCERDRTAIGLVSYVYRIRIPKDATGFNFKVFFDGLYDKLTLLGLNTKLMNTLMYDIMSYLTPFKYEKTDLAEKLVADRVLSTDITSRFAPVNQGKLNHGNIILGNDIKNRRFCYMDTHPKSQSGSNGLIVSSTGCGKSVLAKSICEQILANKDYLYIIDYEGNEYTPFGDEYGATYLDFSGADGRYYEPLRLGTPTGIASIDNDIVRNALNAVYMIIDIMLKHPMTATQKKLINKAIEEYCHSHGVYFEKQNTWKNAKELRIAGILPKLKNYNCSKTMKEIYGHDLTELSDTMENYFEGPEKYMFNNPVSIDELKEKHLVIIRFGGDTKEELVGEEPIDMQIKQLTVMLLVQELARYRRVLDDSFLVLIEELQRYLKHKGSVPWVNTMYTGVRKCNGSILGIINDPEKIKEKLSALVNSSEYVIVGANKDLNALSYLFNTPALAGCERLVKALNNIEHGFLLKDSKTNTTSIFRVELPRQYLESPIYQTRTDAS